MTIQALLQITCIVLMGIMTGIYTIFSNTVLPALKQIEHGSNVMVIINDIILNSWFKGIFFMSAILTAYLGGVASPTDALFRVGCLLFFVGSFCITLLKNVPLNNQLKKVNLTSGSASSNLIWKNYLVNWVFWNHIRAVTTIMGMIISVTSVYI